MTMTPVAPISTPSAAAASSAAAPSSASRYGFGDDGFTFGDLLDIINPLQHIPVVGTIYRAVTGDTMEPGSEIAGGALFGGPIGALLATADVAFTESTGKPIDRTMLGWIGLDGDDAPSTQVAHNTANPAPAHAHAAPATAAAAAPTTLTLTARAFSAATRRIVPLASYTQPLPASPSPPPAASGMPQRIAPMLTEASLRAEPNPAPTTAAPVAAPAATAPATTAAATPELQGAQALLAALRDSGVDPASAARAAAAYQASVTPIVRQPAATTDSTH